MSSDLVPSTIIDLQNGHPVATVAADEGAAFGAALLAGVGAGLWPDVDAACDRCVHVATITNPSAEATAVLNERYDEYRRVYSAVKRIAGV